MSFARFFFQTFTVRLAGDRTRFSYGRVEVLNNGDLGDTVQQSLEPE